MKPTMKHLILISLAILTLAGGAGAAGTLRTVCASGCGYTTLAAALTASSTYDTIEIHAGKDTCYYVATQMVPKAGQVWRGEATQLHDSIFAKNCSIWHLTSVGINGVTIKNLTLGYDSTTVSSLTYLFMDDNGSSGHQFNNLTITYGAKIEANRGGFKINRGSPSGLSTATNCYFKIKYPFPSVQYRSPFLHAYNCDYDSIAPAMWDSCGLHNCRIRCSMAGSGGSGASIRGDSVVLDNCWFGAYGGVLENTEERISMSADDAKKYNFVFTNNTLDSNSHVDMMFDGSFNGLVKNNFINHSTPTGAYTVLYGHGATTLDSVFNLQILNNVFSGIIAGSTFWNFGSTHSFNNVNFKNNMIIGIATYGNDARLCRDTMQYCANSAAPVADSCWWSTSNPGATRSDTVICASKLMVIDSLKYPYLKQNNTTNRAIAISGTAQYANRTNKFLLNRKTSAANITATGFTWVDSLDEKFRYGWGWWYSMDSSKIIRQLSINKTALIFIDTSAMLKAGSLSTATKTALASGTKYFYRSVTLPSAHAASALDTTAWDSATTLSSGGTYDTLWSIAGTGGTVSPASKTDTCTATFRDTATAAAHYAFSGWTARNGRLTIPAPTNRFFAGTFTDQSVSKSDTIDAAFSCVPPTLTHSPAAHICTTGVAVIPWTPTIAETDSIKGRLPAGLSRHKTTGQVTGTPTTAAVKAGYQDTAWGCSAVYGADTITVVHITPIYTLTVVTTGSGTSTGGGVVDSGVSTAISNTPGSRRFFKSWAVTGGATLGSSATTNPNTAVLTADGSATATDTQPNPVIPTLVYPAANDTGIAKTVTLRWSYAAADSFYILDMDTVVGFNSLARSLDTITDTIKTKTFTDTIKQIRYFRVKGGNAVSTTAASAARSYTETQKASTGGNGGLVGTIIGIGIGLGFAGWGWSRRKR